MKLFVENQELEKEVKFVVQQIKLRMNGATVGQMEDRGIIYRLNYGVGLPHLKELAGQIRQGYDLAERLWLYECRETMLLAAMLVPYKDMTVERCQEWARLVNNIDLVERSAMFLWGRLPVAHMLIELWSGSSDRWMNILANYTLGWYVQYSGQCDHASVMDVLRTSGDKKEYLYLKSVSFAVCKMIRCLGSGSAQIMEWIRLSMESGERNLQLMAQEILSEVQFVEEE